MQQFKKPVYGALVENRDNKFIIKSSDLKGLLSVLTVFSFNTDQHVKTTVYDAEGQQIGYIREGQYVESKV